MTELIWNGKYDATGKKTAPVRLALPFQDIETVNESAQIRTLQLDLWSSGQPREWRNRLIWGDKKYVLPALLPEFAGKIDLIYIDPPFNTGSDFSFTATIPDDPATPGDQSATFTKAPSMIEQKAYRDTWGRGLDGYLQWFYETAALLHELLAETGSLYVHLDWHVVHYAKLILDQIFGVDRFVNEIIWRRKQAAAWSAKQFGITNDTLLLYVKSDNYVFNPEYSKEDDNTQRYIKERFVYDDGDGRKYMKSPLVNPLPRPNLKYEFHGVQPPTNGWLYSKARMEEMYANNELVMPKDSNSRIYRKIYADTYQGQIVQNIWTDIPIVNPMAAERLDYATQKPEALLERIIKASSNEGDLVLDCFCGSGTTAAVAEKLNRRWITCDLGRFAIHTTRKRLLNIPNVTPFVVQNLGKYERQAWQAAEFGPHPGSQARHPSPNLGRGAGGEGDAGGEGHAGGERLARILAAQQRYRRFILDLYHAEPLDGYTWLHGVKAGRFVHVGSVDAPIVQSDLQAIAREFWQAVGKGAGATINTVDILGWDFAFETNEVGKQLLADANIKAAFKKIPREVLERRAVEQGDITFFELAALDVEVITHCHAERSEASHGAFNETLRGAAAQGDKAVHDAPGDKAGDLAVQITLRDFVVHPDDVPQDVMSKITHWSQWIDYWAIDWDFRGDTFHNEWQTYRTRQNSALQTSVAHRYDSPGSYTIVVKVIDILGNDTTKSLVVEIK